MMCSSMLKKKDILFAYQPGDSLFHKLHPLTKIIWLILVAVLILMVRSLLLLVVSDIILFSAAIYSGIKLRRFYRQIRWILFLSIIIIPIDVIFNAFAIESGETLFYLAFPYFPIRRVAVYTAFRSSLWIFGLVTTGMIFSSSILARHLLTIEPEPTPCSTSQ